MRLKGREAAATSACIIALATAAPAMAQESLFDGFYLGVNAGISWADTSARTNVTSGSGIVVIPPQDVAAIRAAAIEGDDSDSGFAGGAQAGYNWTSGGLMLGLEADINFMNIGQSNTATIRSPLLINPPVDYTLTQDVETDWMWSIRPRIGYVSGPWMFYATAGLAMSEIKYEVDFRDNRIPANVASEHFSDTKTGWIAGLGLSLAMNERWSVSGEWLYANFGEIDGTVTTPNGFVNLESGAEIDANMARLALNFRF